MWLRTNLCRCIRNNYVKKRILTAPYQDVCRNCCHKGEEWRWSPWCYQWYQVFSWHALPGIRRQSRQWINASDRSSGITRRSFMGVIVCCIAHLQLNGLVSTFRNQGRRQPTATNVSSSQPTKIPLPQPSFYSVRISTIYQRRALSRAESAPSTVQLQWLTVMNSDRPFLQKSPRIFQKLWNGPPE